MDVIFWRHAEAEILSAEGDDLSRCLTPRGKRQANRMAKWLQAHLPEGVRIFSSPAKRTEQTANALEHNFKMRYELKPDSRLEDVLSLLKWDEKKGPQRKGAILLVGHQPLLGQTIAYLLNIPEEACAIRKGSVWWLRTKTRDEEVKTQLITVISPELTSRS